MELHPPLLPPLSPPHRLTHSKYLPPQLFWQEQPLSLGHWHLRWSALHSRRPCGSPNTQWHIRVPPGPPQDRSSVGSAELPHPTPGHAWHGKQYDLHIYCKRQGALSKTNQAMTSDLTPSAAPTNITNCVERISSPPTPTGNPPHNQHHLSGLRRQTLVRGGRKKTVKSTFSSTSTLPSTSAHSHLCQQLTLTGGVRANSWRPFYGRCHIPTRCHSNVTVSIVLFLVELDLKPSRA
jgi:hypothetical protein